MAVGRPISLTPNIATKNISSLATADQTEFTVTGGYRINEIAVYRNGVRLAEGRDFTASDGSTVNLVTAATVSDVIEFAVFDSFNIADAIVSAASSQNVNGDLNVTGNLYAGSFKPGELVVGIATASTAFHVGSALTANAAGDVQTIGIITAATFKGDGSGLTGIGETVNVRTETITVSGVSTFTGVSNFSSAVNVDATTDSTSSTTGALIVDGGVGIAKNVYIGAGLSVAGTLTYEDVTNVDSVGLITAKSGVNVSGGQVTIGTGITMGIAGVATFSGTSDVHLHDNVKLNVGDGSDLQVYHDGSNSYIDDSGTGNLTIRSSQINFNKYTGEALARFRADGNCELFHNNSSKFETTNDGTVTTGISTANGLRSSGGATVAYIEARTTSTQSTNTNKALRIRNNSDTDTFNVSYKGAVGVGTDSPNFSSFGSNTSGIEISDVDTHNGLLVQSGTNEFYFANDSSTNYIWGEASAAIEVATDSTTRLKLTAGGDIEVYGSAAGVSSVTWDASANSLIFKDGSRAKFGDGSDLHVYHNGSNSVIREEGTGNLNIQTTGGNVDILVNTTETAAKFISDGAVELYHDAVKRLETTSSGVTITNAATAGLTLTLQGSTPEIQFRANSVDEAGEIRVGESSGGGVMQFKTKTTGGTLTQALQLNTDQSATFAGSVADSKGDVRQIIYQNKTSGYVLVAADAGKAIHISTGGVTINNSLFSAGDAVTIINNSGSTQTITQGSGVTLYDTGDDGSTGNKTLKARGMATVWFSSASVGYITGNFS